MSNVQGNLEGLSPSQKKEIERLFRRRVHPELVVSHEMALELVRISKNVERQLGVLIDRKGRVRYVTVGDAMGIVLPDFGRVRAGERRFRGLRFIHTHMKETPLSDEDLSDLTLLRLDLICALTVTGNGLPGRTFLAHILPPNKEDRIWFLADYASPQEIDFPFLKSITALEDEFSRIRKERSTREDHRVRALMVVISLPPDDEERNANELKKLAGAADYLVLDSICQRRRALDPRYLIGKGKARGLFFQGLHRGADAIIFNRELSPSQAKGLTDITDLRIIDRTNVILEIFSKRARSSGGKLQVELAELRYQLPRLKGKGRLMSRTGGGIGTRGPGEMKIEEERRRIKDRISRLEREIEILSRKRGVIRKDRVRKGLPVVSIIGYTNTGKSTLINTLTHSQVMVKDQVFATLDPVSRRLRFPRDRNIVITDTVGFIRNMPQELKRSFQATLEELNYANLFLNVMDASDDDIEIQYQSVLEVLREIGLNEVPIINVLNKADLASQDRLISFQRRYDAVAISAIDKRTLPPLLKRIETILWYERDSSRPYFVE